MNGASPRRPLGTASTSTSHHTQSSLPPLLQHRTQCTHPIGATINEIGNLEHTQLRRYNHQWTGFSHALLHADAPITDKAPESTGLFGQPHTHPSKPTATILSIPKGLKTPGTPAFKRWTKDYPSHVQNISSTTKGPCPLKSEERWTKRCEEQVHTCRMHGHALSSGTPLPKSTGTGFPILPSSRSPGRTPSSPPTTRLTHDIRVSCPAWNMVESE